MRSAARFVVETHAHITTLYKAKREGKGVWTGLPEGNPDGGEVETFDNSDLCLYDMERYGVDMCILKPSVAGTTNEMQAKLVNEYPDKFRAYCCNQTQKKKMSRGEAEWSLEAAVEEVEEALKTGNYVGIGEFVPSDPDPKKVYSFKERLEEFRRFMELADKYDVVIDFHEFDPMGYEWDPFKMLVRLSAEYPDVPIILCHGAYSIGSYIEGERVIRKSCNTVGRALQNGGEVYMEIGTWPAEYMKIALKDPNIGPTQLMWGGDYGNVPQYINTDPSQDPSTYSTVIRKWPNIPTYQTDWWGWSLHQIDKLRDLLTQDEINLILGGNAAKVFELPVPHERMFPDGRPDLYGKDWKDSVPLIPKEQVKNPDDEEK